MLTIAIVMILVVAGAAGWVAVSIDERTRPKGSAWDDPKD